MPHCSAAGLDFGVIPAGFNAPLELLTGFTSHRKKSRSNNKYLLSKHFQLLSRLPVSHIQRLQGA